MAAGSGSTVARLRFEFLGDLKGYRESLKTAKTEGDAAAKTLGQSFREALSKAPAAGFLGGLKQDLELGRSKTLILKDAASALKKELGSLSVSALHTGLNGIKNLLGGLKSAAGSVFQGLLIGTGIALFQDLTRVISDVVHVIPDLITKGQAYALTIHDIMVATGGTAEASSRMAATLGFLGESASNMSTVFSQLARNLPDAEKGLNRLGIATRDSNGGMLDAITIIDNVRSTLAGTANGFDKMTQVIELFGGRGALGKLAEYFTLTDSQMAILTKHFQETGQILTLEQVHLADNMKREWDNIQGVLTGVGATLMTIVGPQIIAFFSTVAQVIQDNAKAIETAVGQALQFIFGLLQGLAGLSGSTQTLTSSLGLVETVTDPYAISLNNARSALDSFDSSQKTAAVSTMDQTKAIDKQISALSDLDKAQEKTYKTRLKSIQAILDERLATLDAAEAARSLAQQQHDLNEQLNQAQIDLVKARAGEKDTKTGAMVVNAEDVAKAMQAVSEVQQKQADLAHEQAVNAQKANIQSVKDYVDAIDQLVSDSTDKSATLAELKKRAGALTAGGTPAAGSDSALELQAVLAAETRVKQQATNAAKQTKLEAIKEELAAARSSGAATRAEDAKTRAELVQTIKKIEAQQKAWENQQFVITTFGKVFGSVFKGEESPVQGGFEGARLAGIKFADDVKAAIGGIGDVINGLIGPDGAIGKLAAMLSSTAADIKNITDLAAGKFKTPTIRDILGPHLGDLFGYTEKNPNGKYGLIEGRAAGGPITPGRAYRINEGSPFEGLFSPKFPNIVVPAVPAFPAMGNGAGGSPAIIRIEIGGRALTDYVDEHLSWRRSV